MKNNYRIFLIIISLSGMFSENNAQNFWKQIQSPSDITLHNIFFADSLNGWAAGDSGIVIKTSDGGSSWNILDNFTDNTIWDLHFLDENLGWTVNWLDDTVYNGTIIHKTTNGGEDWETIEFPQSETYIVDIHFINSQTGYAGVNYSPVRGPIYYTTDGGIGWTLADVQPSVLNYPFLPLKKFYSSGNNIFACGGAIDIAGVIWKSTDSGFSWIADSTVAPDPINELYFFDSLNVIGIGGDRELLYGIGMVKTSTGGNFWEYFELEILGVANSMDFRTPAEGWASLGSIQAFIYTTDSAVTWKEVSTPGNAEINDIIFIDSTKGFAVGKDGVILKYNYEPNSIKGDSKNQPQEFVLLQNYPNPFNPTTVISYQLSVNGLVLLKVYDVLGNEIAVLVNEEKQSGTYNVEFNAEGLSSGVYYYKLTAGNYIFTKKMMVVK